MPRIVVVTPAYNAAKFLNETIGSVMAQTFRDLEMVIVDDGSTDDTLEIASSFGPPVRCLSQPNSGQSVARNRGILESDSEFIAFLDADDVWAPEKLEKQVAYMDQTPGTVLACTDYCQGERPWENRESRLQYYDLERTGHVQKNLFVRNFIATSTTLIRRTALADAGLFDPTLRGSQDYDLWLRLAAVGELGCIEEVLSFYRHHPDNTIRTLNHKRHRVRALKICLARWGSDSHAVAQLTRKLRNANEEIGHFARVFGDYDEARAAYQEARSFGNRSLRCLLRIWLLSLPRPLLDTMMKVSGRHQQPSQEGRQIIKPLSQDQTPSPVLSPSDGTRHP